MPKRSREYTLLTPDKLHKPVCVSTEIDETKEKLFNEFMNEFQKTNSGIAYKNFISDDSVDNITFPFEGEITNNEVLELFDKYFCKEDSLETTELGKYIIERLLDFNIQIEINRSNILGEGETNLVLIFRKVKKVNRDAKRFHYLSYMNTYRNNLNVHYPKRTDKKKIF